MMHSIRRRISWKGSFRAVIESMEARCLLSGDPTAIKALPFTNDFNLDAGGLADKDGQGTGFTWVQDNGTHSEYQPSLIDLDTNAGVLKLTSAGNAQAGGNYN